MNNLDKQYQALLQDILDNGVKKEDRTGTGTLSVFGRQIRHKMSEGFPLLTTKKMYFKGIVTELLWFLRGDTNIKYLVDNDCHIWDGDAYKAYEKWNENATATSPFGPVPKLSKEDFIKAIKLDDKFAKQFGELGPIYGKQWRRWGSHHMMDFKSYYKPIDQIQNLIRDLKTNPDSRRLMVSAWNVGELDQMTLPPCHYGFQMYTRELSLEQKVNWLNKNYPMYGLGEWTIERLSDKDYLKEVEFEYNIPTRAISLMYNARSQDVPLGTPFNLASYGLLLEIIAKEVNMIPDELITNMGDCHIYLNQVDGVKEQLTREPYPLPKLNFSWYIDAWTTEEAKKLRENSLDAYIRQMKPSDFTIENYQSHPTIKMPLSN